MGHEKGRPPKGPAFVMLARFRAYLLPYYRTTVLPYYRTILRASRPPATSRAPAPNASSEAPPVEGSAPPAAADAEPPPPPPPAEAEPPPPPPPAVAVPPPPPAVAVAITVAAEAEALLMLTSLPAAMLWRHALTWFWLTPRSCAIPARSCWLSLLYCPVAAAWIWSQSTYWTLPPTALAPPADTLAEALADALAWAKAGAAAARTMAMTAANNITFFNSLPPSQDVSIAFRCPLKYRSLLSLRGHPPFSAWTAPPFSSTLRGAVRACYAAHLNTP